MTIFLWTMLILYGMVIIGRAIIASVNEHPRTVEYTKGEDIASILINSAFFVWILFLLFGDK